MARLSALPCALSLVLASCAMGNPEMAGTDDDQTGTGGGGGGGGGEGGTIAPDANCPAVSFMATRTTPSVQLLIDRSLSMNYKLDTTNNISRYQAVGDAVVQVVGQLQGQVHFGASLYTQDSTACPNVTSTASRGLNNLSQVQQLIQSSSPTGNTPTAAAFTRTAAKFASNPPPPDSPPIIVLATDGFPNNCQLSGDPQADTVAAIASAHADGIRTFVLGIAGVGEPLLQQMANAGQGISNAKYFTASTPQELNAAFQTIIGGVATCEVAIDGTVDPQVADSGTVTLNGTLLKHGTEWEVVNGSTLRLLGAACSELKASPTASVEATFPCTAVILL